MFITIPTYNEKDNVEAMAKAVLEVVPESHIIFADDNSPDGTGEIIDTLASADSRIICLHREKKEGLGKAYIAAFEKALQMGAERIIQMDCDFSHAPYDIPRLAASTASLVIGSRYVAGGGTPGWPFRRRLISRAGGWFIRTVTGMPVMDPTGGFKLWTRQALEAVDFRSAQSSGYSFQLEMNHRACKAGLAIEEIPIIFRDRRAGTSKITFSIALESFKIATRLGRIATPPKAQ